MVNLKNIKNNKINTNKKAFSLVEMMLLLLIISLMLAGSMSIITRKHVRVPKKVSHGKYLCFYGADGNLREQRYSGESLVFDRPVETCVFEPPARASYFFIQAIGGGGAGGDSGYAGGTRTNHTDNNSISPFGITATTLANYHISVQEFNNIAAGISVTGEATGCSGGSGGSATAEYESTSFGYCTYGGSYKFTSKSECANLGGSYEGQSTSQTGSGGSGGSAGTCSTAAHSLVLNLSSVSHSGSCTTGKSGTSASASYPNSASGGNGTDGSGSISATFYGSSCSAGSGSAGTGGYAGSTEGDTKDGHSGSSASRSGKGCSDYHLSGAVNSGCGGSLAYSHTYDKNYLQYGEGGEAGEYKSIFVRSFRTKTIEMVIGKGGSPRNSGSGEKGGDGETTKFGSILTARGGSGGFGNKKTAEEILPGQTTGSKTREGNIAEISSFANAASVAGLKNLINAGFDAAVLGRGGNGGGSTSNCWAGQSYRVFEDHVLASTVYPKGGGSPSVSCSDSDYEVIPAEAGKSGAVVIVW